MKRRYRRQGEEPQDVFSSWVSMFCAVIEMAKRDARLPAGKEDQYTAVEFLHELEDELEDWRIILN